MRAKITFVLSIALLFFSFSVFAQKEYWNEVSPSSKKQTFLKSDVRSDKAKLFELDFQLFLKQLKASGASKVIMPDRDGILHSFLLEPYHQFSEDLAKAYPSIRSYKATREGSDEQLWISVSMKGIQMMSIDSKSPYLSFLEPAKTNSNLYTLYSSKDKTSVDSFVCSTKDYDRVAKTSPTSDAKEHLHFKTYRLAMSASGEYTQYHGGTVEGALSAINATLIRVNGIFNRDLGIKLELIGDTTKVIYTDPETDPYSSDYNSELQSTLDEVIGTDAYDIGHLVLQGSSNGNAGAIGGICKATIKGSGFTSGASPQGDSFDIDYVAHEMGHQLGANHTWSYQSEGTNAQVEPGSGTTIMSYAGIIAGENSTTSAADYFHGISIAQIKATLNASSCGVVETVSNTLPELAAVANFTIPIKTPFKLETSAIDQETQSRLTYCWEQVDSGVVAAANFGPTLAVGAAFRSYPPNATGVRYFPSLNSVKNGELTLVNPVLGSSWETLSEVPRSYRFMLTARDNDPTFGAVAQIETTVDVIKSAGPFKVVSQNEPLSYAAGSLQEVVWDVAGTNLSYINESLVDIYLSTDGGISFDSLLAEGIPNKGSAKVILPNVSTSNARFMVAAHHNIFFAINDNDFSIVQQPFALVGKSSALVLCKGTSKGLNFTFDVADTSQAASVSVEGLPSGLRAELSSTSLSQAGEILEVRFTADQSIAAGSYSVTLLTNYGDTRRALALDVIVRDETIAPIELNTPNHMQQSVLQDVDLQWNGNFNAAYYEVILAEDENFTTIAATATTTFTTYDVHDLIPDTIYYWKVRAFNDCGVGAFSEIYSFQVASQDCATVIASDLPKTITDAKIVTVRSEINIEQELPLASMEVYVKINHTWVNDLSVSLIAPSGTKVQLLNYPCGNYDSNIDAVFSDEGVSLSCDANGTAVSGTVIPYSPLSSFKGEQAKGTWILEVIDAAEQDGGSIEAFELNACFQGSIRPDADGDGVFDDGDDFCLNTPFGQRVDSRGCAIYQLDKNNFSVTVSSQSCVDNPDGMIVLEATTAMNYSYTVSGSNGYSKDGSFTSKTTLLNLAVGEYQICITGTENEITYDQVCLSANISEPQPLSVLTAVTYENQHLQLQLEGSTYYTVAVNDQSYFISGKSIDVPLEEGYNKIKVSGDLSCMGTYEEEVYFSKLPVVYPNPIEDHFFINTDLIKGKHVSIQITNLNASNMYSYNGLMVEDEFGFDTKYWSKGVYVMQLKFERTTVIYKLIKE